MKTIIAGSRTITDIQHVYDAVRLSGFTITEVVSGRRGVDLLGEAWAKMNHIPIAPFPVSEEEWRQFPRTAGFLRNIKMGDYGEALIAVWDGMSSGTAHMIATALVRGLPIYVYRPGVTSKPKE